MYGEDIDWPKRFHCAGWRVVFYPEAEAIHHCGASSSKAPTRFYIEESRANMQYFRRHHGGLAVAGFWLATCLHQLVRISGYGMLYFLKRDRHEKIVFKIRRSVACLLWLTGFLAPEEAR